MNKRLIYALPATVLAFVALALAVMGLLSANNEVVESRSTATAEPAEIPTPEYRYLVAVTALSPGAVMEEEGFIPVSASAPVPEAIPADD
ncbi:MAG: hypothetical protein JJ867_11890, partial [Marinobacter sp.]|nr:hypothetical protein [Marinobacter sp.]